MKALGMAGEFAAVWAAIGAAGASADPAAPAAAGLVAGAGGPGRDRRQLRGQGRDRARAPADRGPSRAGQGADQALVPLRARDLVAGRRRPRWGASSRARGRTCSPSRRRSASAGPTWACTTPPTCSPAPRLGFCLGSLVPGLGVDPAEDAAVRPRRGRQRARQASRRAGRQRRRRRPGHARREDRDRRPAERRQVDALQRAHRAPAPKPATTPSPRSTRTWPSCRSPTSGSSRSPDGRRLERGRPRDDRVPRHRGARPRAPRRARGSATGSSGRSARPTRSATSSAATPAAECRTPRAGSTRASDIELIETELLAADLEQAERRLERVVKQARSGDTEAIAERDWLERVVRRARRRAAGARGARARGGARRPAPTVGADLEADAVRRQRRRGRGRRCRARSPRTPAARTPSPSRSAPGSRSSWRSSTTRPRRPRCAPSSASRSPGLTRLIRAAFELLDLIVFFTADAGKEAMARAAAPRLDRLGCRRRGPHGDPGRPSCSAEVVGWRDAGRRGRIRCGARTWAVADRGARVRGRRRRRHHDQGLTH